MSSTPWDWAAGTVKEKAIITEAFNILRDEVYPSMGRTFSNSPTAKLRYILKAFAIYKQRHPDQAATVNYIINRSFPELKRARQSSGIVGFLDYADANSIVGRAAIKSHRRWSDSSFNLEKFFG